MEIVPPFPPLPPETSMEAPDCTESAYSPATFSVASELSET